ncbi:MAG: hypothetical protein KIS81_02545 [Maricaulaceae bacterium]|nr:hypothetical protein [Maricaulaceae bacterium]
MVKRVALWVFFLSVIFGISPILLVLLSSWIAQVNDCQLHEGFANTCSVLGMDMGGTLYGMFVAGWFAFYTIPLGLIGAVLGLIAFIVGLFTDRKPR